MRGEVCGKKNEGVKMPNCIICGVFGASSRRTTHRITYCHHRLALPPAVSAPIFTKSHRIFPSVHSKASSIGIKINRHLLVPAEGREAMAQHTPRRCSIQHGEDELGGRVHLA